MLDNIPTEQVCEFQYLQILIGPDGETDLINS
jgi:hypothetical protein